MKSVTVRHLQRNTKQVFDMVDQNQETIMIPSANGRGDIFIISADMYNKYIDKAGRRVTIQTGNAKDAVDHMYKKYPALMDRLQSS